MTQLPPAPRRAVHERARPPTGGRRARSEAGCQVRRRERPGPAGPSDPGRSRTPRAAPRRGCGSRLHRSRSSARKRRAAAVLRDEAEALLAVEPLHSSLCHVCLLLRWWITHHMCGSGRPVKAIRAHHVDLHGLPPTCSCGVCTRAPKLNDLSSAATTAQVLFLPTRPGGLCGVGTRLRWGFGDHGVRSARPLPRYRTVSCEPCDVPDAFRSPHSGNPTVPRRT